jgi:uncharacterized protein YegL
MPYEALATAATPALIIYLLDTSESMAAKMDGFQKVDLVSRALKNVILEMVSRSTKGQVVRPRYRVAIFTYNDDVSDLFDGAITVDRFQNEGIPYMKAEGRTDTAAAFEKAEAFLKQEWSRMRSCPAPLVCHMTDGEYTGDDPQPVVRRIMQMNNGDGNVLVENIYLDAQALRNPVSNPYHWPGISREDQLGSESARVLFRMSSTIPNGYQSLFEDRGYSIKPGSRLLFPGNTPEMLEAGFMMSGMTPVVPPVG